MDEDRPFGIGERVWIDHGTGHVFGAVLQDDGFDHLPVLFDDGSAEFVARHRVRRLRLS
ncbi:hypothetical protein [Tsukamurella sputi]|uniref:hypothetical protein n=1 Tax=Tsukamurella sputi TaxID=2591848 RepID=UPI00131580C6|nr:hypothetical protein [Tsukamurella sputi]